MRLAKRLLLLVVLLALVAAACGDDDEGTTETVVVTSIVEVPGETVTSVVTSVVEVPSETTEITFWSTEKEPARVAKTDEIIAGFTAQTGILVRRVIVEEDNLPQLMITNAAGGTLPDVVFHPLDFTIGWANAGILDSAAATEVVNNLGAETFSQGALELATADGNISAVPSDGWGQLLIYRKDLFDAAGLDKPDTYEKITAAAEALNNPGEDFYGITASNQADAVFTQQTWEHIALANGCNMVDSSATVTLNSTNCVEAIDFYDNLLSNYSPAGLQDVVTTRATYFAGQAAMIIWSPFIMDEMAGLRDAALPTCPECADDIAYLAKNSDFVPSFSGPSGAPAQYGQVSYMGIGVTDKTEAAKAFVEYWLSDGYLDWLGVAPEGKFPMRQGTQENPTEYIEGWRQLTSGVDRQAPLSDYYSEEVISGLIAGTNNFARWGFIEGQGDLVTAVYATLPVPATLDQVLAGDLTAEEGAAEMQALVEQEQAFLAEAEG